MNHVKRLFISGVIAVALCLLPGLVSAGDQGENRISTFSNVTEETDLLGYPAFYISVADINGDLYPDLYIHAPMDEATGDVFFKQRILLNVPGDNPEDPFSRKFIDFTEESGIWANRRGTQEGRHSDLAAFADVDNDGDLDVFCGMYFHRLETYTDTGDYNDLFLNDGQGHFTFIDSTVFYDAGLVNSSGAVFTDYNRDGNIDLYVGNWFLDYAQSIYSPNILYQGHGDGTFTDVTAAAQLTVPQPSYGVSVADTNNDGYPDLFASNYCRGHSQHWRNNGNGTFTRMTDSGYGDYIGPSTHACSWQSMPSDFDNDGDIDFFEVLVHGWESGVHSCPLVNVDDTFIWAFERVNRPDDPDPTHHGDHYGSWFDMELDGLPDFIITECGYSNNHIYLFRQSALHYFTVVTEAAGLEPINDSNLPPHNATPLDYDLDGDEDLVFGFASNDSIQLWRNDEGNANNWIIVQLIGGGVPGMSNKAAIDARVTLTVGSKTYMRDVYAGNGHFSPQSPLALTFGLGSATTIDVLEVRWPNPALTTQRLENVPVNQILTIIEQPPATPTPSPTATCTPTATHTPTATAAPTDSPVPTPSPTEPPAPSATPTSTPAETPEPATPTPTIELGVRLGLPAMAHPGEQFYVTGYLDNPGAAMADVPTFFILDVLGSLYFWPEWALYDPPNSNDISYEIRTVPPGTTEITVVPSFVWPDTGSEQISGLYFYGAMLTREMTAVMGRLASVEWGYGPQ